SLHELPLGSAACWQPAIESQVSVVQGLLSLQLSGVPVVHVPARQVSAPLHALPSGQAVPSTTGACWQPRSVSQASVVHGLLSLQSSGVLPPQTPPRQVSSLLQALPSLHEVPSAKATCWQPSSGRQMSLVHGLLSSQSRAVPT